MSRQSPIRKQRSKGIKIKHILQFFLLFAICFWLIYQVKHSHDKKKEFDESDDQALLHRRSTDDIIKLGRKDVHSQVEEIVSKNEKHDDELEEEEEEEEVEGNNEEHERGEKKIQGNENEGLEGEEEEEEIDDHERVNLDTEIDREEDFADDEEREDSDEKENEETNSEDRKKEVSVDDVDRDGDDRSTHEAREEHYKADDASSAVTQDGQTVIENSNEHLDLVLGEDKQGRDSEETNTSKNRKELDVGNGEMAKGSNESDVTIKLTLLGNSLNGSFSNSTLSEGSHPRLEVNNSSTEMSLGNRDSSFENVTESVSHNSINGSISMISSETKGVDSKSGEFSGTLNDTGSSELEKISTSESSMDTSDGKNEIFDSRMPKISEEAQHYPTDFSDSSNSLEGKDVPMDLDTLLHGIPAERAHTEDAAVE